MIDVNVHDDRPKWVQGLEDVNVDEAVVKRNCILTCADYSVFGMERANPQEDRPRFRDKNEAKWWVFEQGTLICRWVYIQEREGNGNPYGGELRRLYKREASDFAPQNPSETASDSVPSPARSAPTTPGKHKRDNSLEVVQTPTKRQRQLPSKIEKYTMGDIFCGIGGTSEGARSADWRVSFGIELDAHAMQAYRENFPGALHLEMNAHEFPAIVKRCVHGVDLCHFSCPCQFWSDNQ